MKKHSGAARIGKPVPAVCTTITKPSIANTGKGARPTNAVKPFGICPF